MKKVSYFCDRCGKEFYLDDYGTITARKYWAKSFVREMDSKAEYEICPECWKSFEAWLKGENINE